MKYLKSERLKFKHSFSNRLLWIAPLMTAVLAWIIGGFVGFQHLTFYWWYMFLLPGTIAILCALSCRKEEQAGKYYSVFSMPLDLVKFEGAKSMILVEKLLIAALFLAGFTSISHLVSPATAVYSPGQSLIGSIGIILASIWQIPMCLYLARKAGIFLPVILNSALSILLPTSLGSTRFWWLFPYCWAGKLAEPLLGIELNGTFTGNCGIPVTVPLVLFLSFLLFAVLAFLDAKSFANTEGK